MSEHTGWPEALRQEGEALDKALASWGRGTVLAFCATDAEVAAARAAFVSKVRRLMATAHAIGTKDAAVVLQDYETADSLLSEKDVNV